MGPSSASEPPAVLEQFMRVMFTHLITSLAQSLRAEDLRVDEVAALHQIDRIGSLRISELAEILDAPLPAASRMVSRLVDLRLVERNEHPTDRRAKVLQLSKEGLALLDRTSRERVQSAMAAAATMPGPVSDTIGNALQKLSTTQDRSTTKKRKEQRA